MSLKSINWNLLLLRYENIDRARVIIDNVELIEKFRDIKENNFYKDELCCYIFSQRILQCFLIAIMWRRSHRRVHYSKVPAHKATMHPGLGRPWYTAALYNAPCYYLLYYITAHCIPRALLIPGLDTSWPATILMERKREEWKRRGHKWIENWETDTYFAKTYSTNFA